MSDVIRKRSPKAPKLSPIFFCKPMIIWNIGYKILLCQMFNVEIV